MVETTELKQKTNWLVPTAVVLGGAGIAAGLYFYMKKPPGVDTGDTIRAHFTFKYSGDGGDYLLLVRFGWYQPWYMPTGFDQEEGMDRYIKEVSLGSPKTYEFDLDCVIPTGVKPDTYDAEGSILSPGMEPGEDWIERVFAKNVFTVRKD